jgi:choline-sulfatase
MPSANARSGSPKSSCRSALVRHRGSAGVGALVATLAGASTGCSRESSPLPSASAEQSHAPDAAPPAAPTQAPPPTPTGPPADCNVVLISVDSLRADMPWSGYSRPIAPRLTELERTAVSYTRAHSVSSYTSMSLGGLLGGRLPSELHRSGYFFGTYTGDVFFPKLLQKAGVHTSGVMAHFYFQAAGLEQGFDDWRIVPGVTFDGQTDRDVTSPQSEQVAEEILGDPANDARRFFFWVHYVDPHDLYLRHDGIDWGPGPRDRYDGEVTFTDRYIAKLLDLIASKPWSKRTVVIVTSDHGEEFGEHQMTRHGFEVWETLVHVPMMFVAPGARPRRIDSLRSGLDLAPTILDLFGVAPPASFEGHSLVKEIYGGEPEERDVIVDLPLTSNSSRRRALLHGQQKLICFDNDSYCRLYDLPQDPLELSPVMRGADWADLKARYDAALKSIKEVPPYACTGECLDADHRKKLAEAAAAKGAKTH